MESRKGKQQGPANKFDIFQQDSESDDQEQNSSSSEKNSNDGSTSNGKQAQKAQAARDENGKNVAAGALQNGRNTYPATSRDANQNESVPVDRRDRANEKADAEKWLSCSKGQAFVTQQTVPTFKKMIIQRNTAKPVAEAEKAPVEKAPAPAEKTPAPAEKTPAPAEKTPARVEKPNADKVVTTGLHFDDRDPEKEVIVVFQDEDYEPGTRHSFSAVSDRLKKCLRDILDYSNQQLDQILENRENMKQFELDPKFQRNCFVFYVKLTFPSAEDKKILLNQEYLRKRGFIINFTDNPKFKWKKIKDYDLNNPILHKREKKVQPVAKTAQSAPLNVKNFKGWDEDDGRDTVQTQILPQAKASPNQFEQSASAGTAPSKSIINNKKVVADLQKNVQNNKKDYQDDEEDDEDDDNDDENDKIYSQYKQINNSRNVQQKQTTQRGAAQKALPDNKNYAKNDEDDDDDYDAQQIQNNQQEEEDEEEEEEEDEQSLKDQEAKFNARVASGIDHAEQLLEILNSVKKFSIIKNLRDQIVLKDKQIEYNNLQYKMEIDNLTEKIKKLKKKLKEANAKLGIV